jgi:hypothetical protein
MDITVDSREQETKVLFRKFSFLISYFIFLYPSVCEFAYTKH